MTTARTRGSRETARHSRARDGNNHHGVYPHLHFRVRARIPDRGVSMKGPDQPVTELEYRGKHFEHLGEPRGVRQDIWECQKCFALVRESRAMAHYQRMHEGKVEPS